MSIVTDVRSYADAALEQGKTAFTQASTAVSGAIDDLPALRPATASEPVLAALGAADLVASSVTKRVETLPCHTQVNGPPGTGKSYAVKVVRRLFPENAVVAYGAGSQRVLVYDPVSFKHRAIIFAEADSLPGVARFHVDDPWGNRLELVSTHTAAGPP